MEGSTNFEGEVLVLLQQLNSILQFVKSLPFLRPTSLRRLLLPKKA